jgi:hypothetical protein
MFRKQCMNYFVIQKTVHHFFNGFFLKRPQIVSMGGITIRVRDKKNRGISNMKQPD